MMHSSFISLGVVPYILLCVRPTLPLLDHYCVMRPQSSSNGARAARSDRRIIRLGPNPESAVECLTECLEKIL